ncbi:Protein mak11 [Umbelopsis nana]
MGSKKRSRTVHEPAEPIKNKIDWEEQAQAKRVKKDSDSDDDDQESEKTLLPVETLTEQITNEDFRIVAGSYERILYGINAFWESSTEKELSLRLEPVFIFPAHTGCIRTVSIGGSHLASGSSDEVIKLYDLKKRKELGALAGQQQGDINAIEFYGKYMLSASDDGTICIWRSKDWELLKTMKGHQGRINSISIHPSGKIALSVSADKTVRLWNLMTAHKASVHKIGKEGLVVRWNAAGTQYAILFDRQIIVYNVADAQPSTTIDSRSKLLSMRYYQDKATEKEYLAVGSEDRAIRIYDAENGEKVAEINQHKMRVKAVEVISSIPRTNGDEQKPVDVLVSVSSDGVMKCWDLQKVISSKGENNTPLGEYDAKCRITCCAVTLGYKVQQKPEQSAPTE